MTWRYFCLEISSLLDRRVEIQCEVRNGSGAAEVRSPPHDVVGNDGGQLRAGARTSTTRATGRLVGFSVSTGSSNRLAYIAR